MTLMQNEKVKSINIFNLIFYDNNIINLYTKEEVEEDKCVLLINESINNIKNILPEICTKAGIQLNINNQNKLLFWKLHIKTRYNATSNSILKQLSKISLFSEPNIIECEQVTCTNKNNFNYNINPDIYVNKYTYLYENKKFIHLTFTKSLHFIPQRFNLKYLRNLLPIQNTILDICKLEINNPLSDSIYLLYDSIGNCGKSSLIDILKFNPEFGIKSIRIILTHDINDIQSQIINEINLISKDVGNERFKNWIIFFDLPYDIINNEVIISTLYSNIEFIRYGLFKNNIYIENFAIFVFGNIVPNTHMISLNKWKFCYTKFDNNIISLTQCSNIIEYINYIDSINTTYNNKTIEEQLDRFFKYIYSEYTYSITYNELREVCRIYTIITSNKYNDIYDYDFQQFIVNKKFMDTIPTNTSFPLSEVKEKLINGYFFIN